MPRVFRVMRKEPDGLPTVSQTSLGVRPGVDVDLDAQNNVLVNGNGMSVAPNWRDINVNRIPKRLRPIVPGAGGSNNTFCFRTGSGAFVQGAFATGLTWSRTPRRMATWPQRRSFPSPATKQTSRQPGRTGKKTRRDQWRQNPSR
jgi:hypothetical protein